MKETIEKIVNAWADEREGGNYQFEYELASVLPEYVFAYDGQRWFIASEL